MRLPKLTYKLLPKKDVEKGHIRRYQERLLGRFSTLKRMISNRKERIKEKGEEKNQLEREIRNLKKKIEKKSKKQIDLKDQINEIEKELKVYTEYFKNQNDSFDKEPSFYIKVHNHKEGYQYYHGRIRYFMRRGRKRREKWVYFGPVWKLNRKHGDKVEEVLKEQLKDIYYSDLYGE